MLYKNLVWFVLGSVLLISCVSSPHSSKEHSAGAANEASLPFTDPDYDNTLNRVNCEGWSFFLPDNWIIQSPLTEADASQIIRIISPGESSLSLHKIDVTPPVNPEMLKNYAIKELKEKNYKISDRVLEPLSVASGRGQIDAWQASYKTGKGSLLLETGPHGFFEWRMHVPSGAHSGDWDVMHRIFREAEQIDRNRSLRQRSTGFFFAAQDGPWRWLSDFGDGFILERMVSEDEISLVCSFFHLNTIKESESWFRKLEEGAWEKTQSTLILQSETVEADLYSLNPDEKTLQICLIVPGFSEEIDRLCIFMICSGTSLPVPEDIPVMSVVADLLRFNLVIPEGETLKEDTP